MSATKPSQAARKVTVNKWQQKAKGFTCEMIGPVSEGPGPPLPPACPLTGAERWRRWRALRWGLHRDNFCHSLYTFGIFSKVVRVLLDT